MRRVKRRFKGKNRLWKKLACLLVSFLLILLMHRAFSFFFEGTNTDGLFHSTRFKAAIVDQLSFTQPNQTFIRTATAILTEAGFTVDYYSGSEVSVELYRNLPTCGYRLIILRVHSSATDLQGRRGPVTLFTSERLSHTKYVYEQLTDQLLGVGYSIEEKERGIIYFGITPLFVANSMKGRFQDTIIIMMGCEGLNNTFMAKAFVEKGAKVYIGWNQGVLASHTDSAVSHLLRKFLLEKLTLKESVQETLKEVGFDPVYKSLLIYYPIEAGSCVIKTSRE